MKKFEITFGKTARLLTRGCYVGVFYEKGHCFDREPGQSPGRADVWRTLRLFVYLIPFVPIMIVFRKKSTEYANENEFYDRQEAINKRADRGNF